MSHQKKILACAVTTILSGASLSAAAALTTSSNLNFVSSFQETACLTGGTPPDNCNGGFTTQVTSGSWFAMDANGSGTFEVSERVGITRTGPIHIGTAQIATGSHGGSPNGSESPAFDIWEFLGNTGMSFTASPITVANDLGATKELNFSGWRVTWNGIPSIDMGGGTQDCGTATDGICVDGFIGDIAGTFDNGTGLATITCSSSSCSTSSTYVLDYTATVPQADPSNFGGVNYAVHLEGVIATPIHAAVWLFGSGLVGLAGAARRRVKQ